MQLRYSGGPTIAATTTGPISVSTVEIVAASTFSLFQIVAERRDRFTLTIRAAPRC